MCDISDFDNYVENIKPFLTPYNPVDLTNLKPNLTINNSKDLEREAKSISDTLFDKSKLNAHQ